jgi:predicted HNH restriction endonuclease
VIARERLKRKARAVAIMGDACRTCGRSAPRVMFEFHHRIASEKAFGISEDGIMRSWPKVVAELQKCVMLCANCHREVHAGVRELDKRLAEDAVAYAA